MADAQSQLAEVNSLIAANPSDASLLSLREDLIQLINLEKQTRADDGKQEVSTERQEQLKESGSFAPLPPLPPQQRVDSDHGSKQTEAKFDTDSKYTLSSNFRYTAQGTFTEQIASREAIAEAPDLAPFQPVIPAASAKLNLSPPNENNNFTRNNCNGNLEIESKASGTVDSTEKKKKKKKRANDLDDRIFLEAKFEIPPHLVPLESDTPAQKIKKQRTAKALKSKFREKQKEMEHLRRQNDWKSFAFKNNCSVGGSRNKRKKKIASIGTSIFATEEGVNAKVGVISGGGGGRKMTSFADQGGTKRHKLS